MTIAILGAWVPDAASYGLAVEIGASLETVFLTVIPGRPYWVSGDRRIDGASGEADLLRRIEETVEVGHTLGAGVWGLGGVGLAGETITGSTNVLVRWIRPETTFPAWVLGYDGLTDQVLDASTAGPSPLVWRPQVEKGPDTRDRQVLVRGGRTSISGRRYTASFGDAAKTRGLDLSLVPQGRVLEEFAGSQTAFESLDRQCLSLGRPFRLYEDESTISAGTGAAVYVLEEPARYDQNNQLGIRWDVRLRARAYAP